MGYRSPGEGGDPQAREAVARLAQAGADDRSAAQQKELQLAESRRATRHWYAVRTLWRPVGKVALLVYPFLVAGAELAWLSYTGHWSWLPVFVLLPGWPALFFLRRRQVHRAIQAELAWPRSLPWPVEGYAEWIAGEHKHVLVTFAVPPDYQTIEDALSGAVNPLLDLSRTLEFDRRTERAIGIAIPVDLVAWSGEHTTYSVQFGDTRAFHALVDALLVIDRVTRIESIRFTTIELFGVSEANTALDFIQQLQSTT